MTVIATLKKEFGDDYEYEIQDSIEYDRYRKPYHMFKNTRTSLDGLILLHIESVYGSVEYMSTLNI